MYICICIYIYRHATSAAGCGASTSTHRMHRRGRRPWCASPGSSTNSTNVQGDPSDMKLQKLFSRFTLKGRDLQRHHTDARVCNALTYHRTLLHFTKAIIAVLKRLHASSHDAIIYWDNESSLTSERAFSCLVTV